eukprot:s2392_g5.t12
MRNAVPCKIYHKDHKDIRQAYLDAKTTTKEMGFGIGVKLHGDLKEAWHMGQPLFRCAQEWCVPLNKGVPPTESMAPSAVPTAEANKEKPDASSNRCPVQLHSEADISPAQEEAAPKQSARKKRGQKSKAGAKKSGKEQADRGSVVEAQEKAAAARDVSLPSMGAERSSSSASCPVGQVQLELVKTIQESPTEAADAFSQENGDSERQASGHANERADMALPQQAVPTRSPPGLEDQKVKEDLLDTISRLDFPVTVSGLPPSSASMNSNGAAEAAPVDPAPQLTWAQRLVPKKPEAGAQKPKTQPVSILKNSAKAKTVAEGPESPRGVDSGGFATEVNPPPPPPYPPQVPMPSNPVAAPKYPPPPPLHPPSHYLMPGSRMDPVASGGAIEDKMWVTGESFHTTHAPASSGPATESETSSPHRTPQSHFAEEASDEESFRSDSEGDVPDYWDGQDAEDEETVISEHAKLQEVVAEMNTQGDIQCIGDLKGRLVSGTFRVVSGSDFRGRRSKAQLVVDQGPKKMLGCRVHVVGNMNRKRAWDHDRCWVKILAARVATDDTRRRGQDQDMSRPWNADTAELTTFFGHVVLSQEQRSPRQNKVVCMRSRLVRSTTSMMFRPINGKFPMIAVPWNPQKEVPNLYDLHVIELQSWKSDKGPKKIGHPVGIYEEELNMRSRDSDESVLYSIKRSLNYCDWEDHSIYSSIPVDSGLQDISKLPEFDRREDLRCMFTLCIEHQTWPANMAISINKNEIRVHVIDVTEYLSQEVSGKDLEAQARARSCGAWLLDCKDQAVSSNLPLLQPEFTSKIDFSEGEDRLALTFRFSLDGDGIQIPKRKAAPDNYCESVVRCDRRLTFAEAKKAMAEDSDLGASLKKLSVITDLFEAAAFQKGQSFPFEHWEPQVGLKLPVAGFLKTRRIVECLSFMVNLYAGQVLDRQSLWQDFLSAQTDVDFMPSFVYGRADTQHHRALHRLLQYHPSAAPTGLQTSEAVEALSRILGQEHLSPDQRFALQKAFLRQIRMGFPRGFYHLGREKLPWSTGTTEGQLFHRPRIFHVAAPMNRYIDLLGQRALKKFKGWTPGICSWLRPTMEQMQEAVDRTNARMDSHRFAGYVMRHISHMRELAPSSKKVRNAVVGYVGPSMIEVLIPHGSGTHFSMSIPTSAIRSATCQVEFDTELQQLKIVNVDPWRGSSASRWSVRPWSTEVSCTISRNFAQPIKHHASANAMFITEITFTTPSGKISLNVGHRMYPEVFSAFPDLKNVHLMEKDLSVYAETWFEIWRCRTHAAASETAAYTEWMRPVRLTFEHKKKTFSCLLIPPESAYDKIEKGDLAILRASDDGREAFLYGEIASCEAKKYKSAMCNRRNCPQIHCDFRHPGEEAEGTLFRLEVELSEVSYLAQQEQQQFLDMVNRTRGGAAFQLQIVGVPVVDRQNLKLVHKLPEKLKTRQGRECPVAAHLTSLQPQSVLEEQKDMRPLATREQVEAAVGGRGQFRVPASALNDLQMEAVKQGLQRRFSVVQGPPGTGKTTFLVHLVTSLANLEVDPTVRVRTGNQAANSAAQDTFGRILVTTPSNQAADECLRRLIQETNIPEQYITRVYARTIEYKYGSKLRHGWDPHDSNLIRTQHQVAEFLQEHALHNKVMQTQEVRQKKEGSREYDEVYEDAEQKILKKSRIVITTCSSAMSHGALKEIDENAQTKGNKGTRRGRVQSVTFRSVVVDECAQATEPEVVLCVMRAQDRAILVGDHKQLGPVVTEHNLCRAPILERLAERKEQRTRLPSTMLQKQYRMHTSISHFPSKHFYNDRLENVENLILLATPSCLPACAALSWNCTGNQNIQGSLNETVLENNTSLENPGEADVIVEVYKRLLAERCCTARDVAIITPYKAQQQYIERKLSHLPGTLGKNASETAVGTVFSMQGSERHFVLLSFVRSVAEGWALQNLAMQGSESEIRVAVTANNPALRQTFESHIGIAAKATLLNVALTRAKSGLVIVGNRTILSEGSEDFFQLPRYLRNNYRNYRNVLTRIALRAWPRVVAMAPLESAMAPSEALRQLVLLGSEEGEAAVASAVKNLDKDTPSSEWLWAAVAHFLGLVEDGSPEFFPRAFARPEALSSCSDCAMLWGFGSLYGLFQEASSSHFAQLARQHQLSEGVAAYAVASELGSSLGRLAWGEERLNGVIALQHRGIHLPPERLNCMESLEAAMAVASGAAQEQSSVPQPMDLDHLVQARHEERQSYALAAQLASDGHVEGMAAKAEMLYYGKSGVVPGSGAGKAWVVVPLLLLAAWKLPKLCSRETQAGAPNVRPRIGGCLRMLMLLAAFGIWWSFRSSRPGDLAPDTAQAQELFQEAADAGHWGAAYAYALLKLEENESEAEPYLRQVVQQGEAPACFLAEYFMHRHGFLPSDSAKEKQLLQQAAKLGDPMAANLLAERFARADGADAAPDALRYYRQAAMAGQLPTRYNIGVLLIQSLNGTEPTDALCLEARQEFVEVARDMDPTVRLLFALAMRSWELGNATAALTIFSLLSEAGVTKAHRNAARIWEQQTGTLDPLDFGSPVQDGDDSLATCNASDDATAELVATGRFCCSSGNCSAFRFNEPGFLPSECMLRCSMDAKCVFATTYATGYCQLSEDCDTMAPASDPSAQIFRVKRPQCRPATSALAECSPQAHRGGSQARRCAALFWARAAEHPSPVGKVELELPHGSALLEAGKKAATAAAATGRHLEWLGDLETAMAWSCAAAKMNSAAGRLRCAALQADTWPGHAANLSRAAAELRLMASQDPESAVAVYATLSSLFARFWRRAVLEGCELPPGRVLLPRCDLRKGAVLEPFDAHSSAPLLGLARSQDVAVIVCAGKWWIWRLKCD